MIVTEAPASNKHWDFNVSPEHAGELEASAIPLQVALDAGVYTASTTAELPEWARWIGDDALPALVYPMTHPDGTETGQVKPVAGSVKASDGRALKYVSPSKDRNPPKLPVVRNTNQTSVMLIVEGVKQALATLAWAPPEWSIYRIAGIWSWMSAGDGDAPGAPTPHLTAAQGRTVVIIPDADAKSNIRVFDGAVALGEACTAYGAESVKFVRLPGAGKDGVDDHLARLADDESRRNLLMSWVKNARPRPADLDQRQQKRMRKERNERDHSQAALAPVEAPAGRVAIDVSRDMRDVSIELVDALVEHAGGKRVFQRGGKLVRVRPSRESMEGTDVLLAETLSRNQLRRELLDAVYPYTITADGPKPTKLIDMIVDLVFDHSDRFPWLAGVTRSPVVCADGEILTRSGYHAASGVYLDLSPDVVNIDVPDHPTDGDILEARALMRDDLLAMDGAGGYDGWAFASEADQTHAMAGLMTPVIRPIVNVVPLLLLDGVHRGVGKGGLMDTIHCVAFGRPAPMQVAPKKDDEMDKRITAKLTASADSVVLDEVQDEDGSRLRSNALATALTAEIPEGRTLGKSEILNLPNLASWYALGNNVEIPGDMVRRVYTCRLSSDRADLETRDNFRHDLDTWVPEHRAELLRAVLVLIRAWYDRGQPEAPRQFGFKSFEQWQRVVGGILHLAGFRGFLSTVLEVRENADSESVDNAEHWAWLENEFSAGARFGASDVLARAKVDPDAPPPYGKSWAQLDGRKLSVYYGQHPRWYDGLRIRRDGKLHGGGKAYILERLHTRIQATSTTATGTVPSHPRPAAGAAHGEVIEIFDRHGFKEKVSRAMPPIEGEFIAELEGGMS